MNTYKGMLAGAVLLLAVFSAVRAESTPPATPRAPATVGMTQTSQDTSALNISQLMDILRVDTDTVPCYETYVTEMFDRLMAFVKTWDGTNIGQLASYIVQEAKVLCGEHDTILTCVSEKVKTSTKEADSYIKVMLTGPQFKFAQEMFTYTCSKIPVFEPHVECLINQMMSKSAVIGKCMEGATAIMSSNTPAYYTTSDKAQSYCGMVHTLGKCFKPHMDTCATDMGMEFTNIVNRMYLECVRPVLKYVPDSNSVQSVSDLTECFYNLLTDAKVKAMTEGATVQQYDKIYTALMEVMCQNNAFQTCMDQKLPGSTKMVDKVLKKMFTMDQIREIFKYGCSIVPAFKQKSSCMFGEIEKQAKAPGATVCIMMLMSTMNDTQGDTGTMATSTCSNMKPFQLCMAPAFTTCSSSLADSFTTFMGEITSSCGKPSYQVTINAAPRLAMSVSSSLAALAAICMWFYVTV